MASHASAVQQEATPRRRLSIISVQHLKDGRTSSQDRAMGFYSKTSIAGLLEDAGPQLGPGDQLETDVVCGGKQLTIDKDLWPEPLADLMRELQLEGKITAVQFKVTSSQHAGNDAGEEEDKEKDVLGELLERKGLGEIMMATDFEMARRGALYIDDSDPDEPMIVYPDGRRYAHYEVPNGLFSMVRNRGRGIDDDWRD